MNRYLSRRVILLLCTLIFSVNIAYSQEKKNTDTTDTLNLEPVEINDYYSENIWRLTNSFSRTELDKVSSLTAHLEQTPGLAVRSYAPGGLATLAFRGTTAAQTNVTWNQLPIVSPQNGLFDFNLAPAYLTDHVNVNTSDGIGGEIGLSSTAYQDVFVRQKPLTGNIRIGAGSFGFLETGIRGNFTDGKLSGNFRILDQRAQNDFSFANPYTGESERQNQARFGLQGAVFNLNHTKHHTDSFRLGTSLHLNQVIDRIISFSGWVQQSERQIPPTLLAVSGKAIQNDRSMRGNVKYVENGKKSTQVISVGGSQEYLLYRDTLAKIEAPYTARQVMINARQFFDNNLKFFFLPPPKLMLTADYLLQSAQAETYQSENLNRSIYGFQAKIIFYLTKSFEYGGNCKDGAECCLGRILTLPCGQFTLFGGFKQASELKRIDYYGFNFDYQLPRRKISFRLKGEKAYRIPTFNDLFWTPGGNPNLIPETGYNAEAGFAKNWYFKTGTRKSGIRFNTQVYSKVIRNGIVWLPTAGFWSPVNVSELWARGWESQISGKFFPNKKLTLEAEAGYDFCRSEPVRVLIPGDASIHKQVMYVPVHQARFRFSAEYRSFRAEFRQNYTGIRYIVTDESQFLPAFWLTDFRMESELSKKKHKIRFRLSAEILNLFNQYFETIALRPQPGRNFRLTLEADF